MSAVLNFPLPNSPLPNSPHARDVASLMHGMTNLVRHENEGPLILEEGHGVYVKDLEGKRVHRGHGGPVVHGAGVRQRAPDPGRDRTDAEAADLPHLLPALEHARHRSRRAVARDGAGTRWRGCGSRTRAPRRTTTWSSSSGTTTTPAAGRRRRRSSPASTATTASRCRRGRSPACPRCTRLRPADPEHPPYRQPALLPRRPSRLRARKHSRAGARRSWSSSSSPRVRTPWPPSSPSRSWGRAARSSRRRPTSRRSRQCLPSTTC